MTFGTKDAPRGGLSYDYASIQPELTESWEISEDGMTLTFTLKDATFQDGSPVTAEDVKWSFDRALTVGGFPTVQMKAGGLERPDQFSEEPETLHPVTRQIVAGGLELRAVVEFETQYRLADLMTGIDMLCVPTIPRFVSLAEIAADPIGPNSLLGTYSNFVNLLDMSGDAVPCRLRADGRPASVTLLGRAGANGLLAAAVMQLEDTPMGATGWARPPDAAALG
ncbi:ABC transporter substrate-binding protein [Salipiger thiooxidans]|uniref:ABC transporter substrate-binding protein n=1 Tax=Salipiger thiooxidans TaxID=282683 RepID=UPI001CD5213A|nr:ABC transporter substrate-binding protein [Salipiger thiooxidans]MCA0848803.1 ABC transporter substrate-binding protein [Salipiger thiooxidans]